jgi:small redox-active disulfide protein 2
MALFGKKKEEVKAETSCCCGSGQSASEVTSTCCGEKVNGICCIKVLGSGCKSCHQLYENTLKAVEGLEIEVEYITNLQKIMEYGAMSMPALVINEKVVSVGRVLKSAEISAMINDMTDKSGGH